MMSKRTRTKLGVRRNSAIELQCRIPGHAEPLGLDDGPAAVIEKALLQLLALRPPGLREASDLLVEMLFAVPRMQRLAQTVAGKSIFTSEPGLAIPASLIFGLILVLLTSNALGFFERAPTVYVLSLLGPLIVAGMIFVRLTVIAARNSR